MAAAIGPHGTGRVASDRTARGAHVEAGVAGDGRSPAVRGRSHRVARASCRRWGGRQPGAVVGGDEIRQPAGSRNEGR
ncbi:hypothetical protein E2562_024894 [Oryza meyeriana var. granulata]|uniref:Uncharacterized protein n=1 Tax=Oryza meyeriana var. granulata TaxID=110450 RepID=A0A6G1DMT9_9ORYZ|nr:hypothetical protein E2562_024894 [Oryza meyeriana var. granulata]